MVDQYIFSGSLPENASTYVTREADAQLYEGLKAGTFCYVLNSRQSGKSSLRVRTMQRLREDGVQCAAIDLSSGGIQNVPPEQWYADLIDTLIDTFGLDIDFGNWWSENQLNTLVTRFRKLLEEILLVEVQEHIVIFIDEIDSVLSLNFPTDDFFALIRACYNKRVDNPEYNRLTFCLLGVASPTSLIKDKQRTPFNIGQAISLKGFQLHEAEPLAQGLRGRFSNPQAIMQEILQWTGGQPFLTQKLCQFMVEESEQDNPRSVEQVVRSRIIENWESQDEPEHLRTIQARILRDEQRAGYLLELYQQIRLSEERSQVIADETLEQSELQLSGLVVRQQNKLRIYNQIYREIFDSSWIETQLNNLRPYSENFRFWVASKGTDESRLLRGKALEGAEEWAKDKNLSYQDKQYLAASKEKEIQEEIAAKEQDAALERERKDREAAEERNQLLSEANKKAQRRISIGVVVLVVAVLGAAIVGIWSKIKVEEATSQEQHAKTQAEKSNQDAIQAKSQAEKSNQDAIQAKNQAEKSNQDAIQAKSQAEKFNQDAEQAKNQVTQANQDAEQARNQVAQANQDAEQAKSQAEKFNQDAEQAKKQNQELQQQQQNIKGQLEKQQIDLSNAQKEGDKSKTQLLESQQKLAKVKNLSEEASQLQQKAEINSVKEANESLNIAGLVLQGKIKEPLADALLDSSLAVGKYYLTGEIPDQNQIQRELEGIESHNYEKDPTNLATLVYILYIKGKLSEGNEQLQAYKQASEKLNQLKKLKSDEEILSLDINILYNGNADIIDSLYRELLEKDKPNYNDYFSSLKNHYLKELGYLMQKQRWKEADIKNEKYMLYLTKREKQEYLGLDACRNFPKEDLRAIDQLWVKYSNGRFGFSVQKKIWLKNGGKLDGKILNSSFTRDEDPLRDDIFHTYSKLSKEVGWENDRDGVLSYHQFTFNTNAPAGHLPSLGANMGGDLGEGGFIYSLLLSRL